LPRPTLGAAKTFDRARLAVNTASLVVHAPPWQSLGTGPAPYVLGEAVWAIPAQSIALRNRWADFRLQGWDVRGAVDGDGRTGWAVLPEVNKDHTAVFELAEPIGYGQESLLTVRLKQQFGASDHTKVHTLGRFRLAFTTDATALAALRVRWMDLKDNEIADVHASLGKAHAQQGRTSEAIGCFAQALPLAVDRSDKARIITEAAPLEGVLPKLAEFAAGDGRLQAELTRHFAERGEAPLAEAAHKKARAWYEAKLAKEPKGSVKRPARIGTGYLLLRGQLQSTVSKYAECFRRLNARTANGSQPFRSSGRVPRCRLRRSCALIRARRLAPLLPPTIVWT
jgi:hypothetical protein